MKGLRTPILVLTFITLFAALLFASWSIGELREDVNMLKAENLAMVTLLEVMVESDKLMLDAIESNTTTGSINTEIVEVLAVHVVDHEQWAIAAIAEIYQGHIIRLSAYHMGEFGEVGP